MEFYRKQKAVVRVEQEKADALAARERATREAARRAELEAQRAQVRRERKAARRAARTEQERVRHAERIAARKAKRLQQTLERRAKLRAEKAARHAARLQTRRENKARAIEADRNERRKLREFVQRKAQEARAEKEDRVDIWKTRSLDAPVGSANEINPLRLIDVMVVGPDEELKLTNEITLRELLALAGKAKLRPLEAHALLLLQEGYRPVDIQRAAGASDSQVQYALKRIPQKMRAALGIEPMPHYGRPKVPKEIQQAKARARTARRKQELITAGICIRCGKRPKTQTSEKCAVCNEHTRVRNERRKAAGVCTVCGLDRDPDGSVTMCSICLGKLRDRQKSSHR